MEQFKGIPYGISNFKQLRRENLYFVDKSHYIQKLEESGHFLFLIRPRCFGKSIFLNMLRAYYDVNESASFDTLFDDLWIKEHPTPEKCGYQVMYMDFSRVGGRCSKAMGRGCSTDSKVCRWSEGQTADTAHNVTHYRRSDTWIRVESNGRNNMTVVLWHTK